eukprot:TRINITY_DN8640_c0_g2_i1.p1 TRINITY_DN8640_c0_g2~~TRINITY_DN8640_c0_g2_i1.p1  ORF type:complete len:1079 (-),score=302.31 TRINITY_DN8640_c0_g2_i1:208-3444(-)
MFSSDGCGSRLEWRVDRPRRPLQRSLWRGCLLLFCGALFRGLPSLAHARGGEGASNESGYARNGTADALPSLRNGTGERGQPLEENRSAAPREEKAYVGEGKVSTDALAHRAGPEGDDKDKGSGAADSDDDAREREQQHTSPAPTASLAPSPAPPSPAPSPEPKDNATEVKHDVEAIKTKAGHEPVIRPIGMKVSNSIPSEAPTADHASSSAANSTDEQSSEASAGAASGEHPPAEASGSTDTHTGSSAAGDATKAASEAVAEAAAAAREEERRKQAAEEKNPTTTEPSKSGRPSQEAASADAADSAHAEGSNATAREPEQPQQQQPQRQPQPQSGPAAHGADGSGGRDSSEDEEEEEQKKQEAAIQATIKAVKEEREAKAKAQAEAEAKAKAKAKEAAAKAAAAEAEAGAKSNATAPGAEDGGSYAATGGGNRSQAASPSEVRDDSGAGPGEDEASSKPTQRSPTAQPPSDKEGARQSSSGHAGADEASEGSRRHAGGAASGADAEGHRHSGGSAAKTSHHLRGHEGSAATPATPAAPTPAAPSPAPTQKTDSSAASGNETSGKATAAPRPAPSAADAEETLPDNFARIEQGEDWKRSPFVSQSRLESLWRALFTTYNKEVPPVPDFDGPLPIGVGMNVVKFKDFDEVAGTMNVAINLRLCWADSRLSFDSLKYFNMTWQHDGDKIPVKSSLVWTPDVTIINEVGSMRSLVFGHNSPLVLADEAFMKSTGVNVLWSHPMDVVSNCDVDMSRYPFDEQRCYIVVGSWASSRRQMVLVPQPFFEEATVHSSEFHVKSITFTKRDEYTSGTSQMFNEVLYSIVFRRYPHYYIINFILPMVAMTLLTVSTMWMSPGNVGPRVNSGTKLLLCVVSIIFITARRRPPVRGDIWMDRFQSHCLALSMSAVLESLFIDWLSKTALSVHWLPRTDMIDSLLRAAIAATALVVVSSDAREVHSFQSEAGMSEGSIGLGLVTSLRSDSTGLLVFFVILIFVGLILSSAGSVLWILSPRWLQRRILGQSKDGYEVGGLQQGLLQDSSTEPDSNGGARKRTNVSANGAGSVLPSLSQGAVYTACPTQEHR